MSPTLSALLMEHVFRLRSELVQYLLEECRSFKAKRLFLCLSEYHQHDFLGELNLKCVDLGLEKMIIAGGGENHEKYKISIPRM